MGSGVSSIAGPESDGGAHESGLGDLSEICVAKILMGFDPVVICRLAMLNRTFWEAAMADFVWEAKLPENYRVFVERVLGEEWRKGLGGKMRVYERLCRRSFFDGATKEFWIEKQCGGVCMSISSKALLITGIDDRKYWNYIPTEESRISEDASAIVFMGLDDPADLVRACTVPKSWYSFVIYKRFLQKAMRENVSKISNFSHVSEERRSAGTTESGVSGDAEMATLEREHKAYSYLSHCLVLPIEKRIAF